MEKKTSRLTYKQVRRTLLRKLHNQTRYVNDFGFLGDIPEAVWINQQVKRYEHLIRSGKGEMFMNVMVGCMGARSLAQSQYRRRRDMTIKERFVSAFNYAGNSRMRVRDMIL